MASRADEFERTFEHAVEVCALQTVDIYGVSLEVGRERARAFLAEVEPPRDETSLEEWFEGLYESAVELAGDDLAVRNGISAEDGRAIIREQGLAWIREFPDFEDRLVRVMLAWADTRKAHRIGVELGSLPARVSLAAPVRGDGRVEGRFVVRRSRETRRRSKRGRRSSSRAGPSDDPDDLDDSGPEPGDAGPLGRGPEAA
jgi:hypothetical protein